LIKYFQRNVLTTAVGDFTYEAVIGEGGNAKVLAFSKGALRFAVKFLPHGRTGPLARFRDEFFCAAQIPSHPNVTRGYHLETTEIEGTIYSLIVMKLYDANLSRLGSIAAESDTHKAERGWKLLRDLRAGIEHLHRFGIVHRDIKPQNIFYDQQADTFVIGDLGIAHFADDYYTREAATEGSERLANFSCCAPEQMHPKAIATQLMDIFALGQVLNWYIRGAFVRGGGRQTYSGANQDLKLLDQIVEKCLQDDPRSRFQSIGDLERFEQNARLPPRNPWKHISDLDRAFRASIPRIPQFYETEDPKIIDRFLTNFSKDCDSKDFWYVRSDGGDNYLESIYQVEGGRWLLVNAYECRVERLVCYRHSGEWQSFFVLLVAADEPFVVTDTDGNPTPRPDMNSWNEDVVMLYEDRYMEIQDAENGYFEHGDVMVRIDRAKAQVRHRFLQRDAFLILPTGVGASRSQDREPAEIFLQDVVRTGTTTIQKIRHLLQKTIGATDDEITKWR
jgi:eukaryotic-like serine/threonine-protein kinase